MRIPVPLAHAYRLLNHGATTLVSTAHGGRRNVMAAAWVMPLDFEPPKFAAVVAADTLTRELPTDHLGPIRRLFDDPADVWFRGDLVGLDTGAGKDGYLSALMLPSLEIFTSR